MSPSLEAFQEALKKEGSFLVEGLWESPKAYLASLIAKTTGKSILIITGGTREDRLFTDLSYFMPEGVLEFPSWETLPGEEIAPSPDILGKRFEALYSLIHRKSLSIVICPLQALLQKVLPKTDLGPLLTIWKKGTEISFDSLAEKLTALGYKRAAVVSDKGEFAIRGGILDLFPVSSTDPYRIEFFADTIEEIRIFDPIGQKTIGKKDAVFLSPALELPLLKNAKRLCSIAEYLGQDPIFFWDDLLAIEDAFVSLKKMPAAHSLFLYSIDEFFKKKNQHIYCTAQNIEELSEVGRIEKRTKYFSPITFEAFQEPFAASRFFHPFQKIDIEEIPSNALFLNLTPDQIPKLPENAKFEKGVLT